MNFNFTLFLYYLKKATIYFLFFASILAIVLIFVAALVGLIVSKYWLLVLLPLVIPCIATCCYLWDKYID